MKRLIFICVIVLLWSCSSSRSDNSMDNGHVIGETDQKEDRNTVNTTNQMEVTDSIVLIELPNGVTFNWDNQLYRIVEDTLFNSIAATFSEKQQSSITLILDTTITQAKVCSIDRNLFVGDLTFLLIDKTKSLPIADVLQMQCDVFEQGCPYPLGFFNAINIDRSGIKNRIESYLTSKE